MLLIFGITFFSSVSTSLQASSVSITIGSSTAGCEKTKSCFQPYETTVDVGGEVTWTNDDSAAHTVTSGNPTDGADGLFDSNLLGPVKTFTHKFEKSGEFNYYCTVHPWMIGIVKVSSGTPTGDKIQINNIRTVDEFGKLLASGTVNKQMLITSDLTNLQNVQQPFAYVIQVKDSNDITVTTSWIEGTLNPGATAHPAQSWIPSAAGTYTVGVFVWESIQKPAALAKPVSINVTVDGGVPQNVPSPPTNLITKMVSQTQVNLSWQPPANSGGSAVTGYKIDVKVGSGNYSTLTTVGNTNTYSHTGLSPGTTYTYRVSAINSVGTSKPSNEVVEFIPIEKTSDAEKYTIPFKTGEFFPVEGLDVDGIVGNRSDKEQVHFLLQFTEMPTNDEQQKIFGKGINLLDYISGNAYIASAKVGDLKSSLPNLIPRLRSANIFDAAFKISPNIMEEKNPSWAVINSETVLTVEFNRDVIITEKEAPVLIKNLGGDYLSMVSIDPSITASFDLEKIKLEDITKDDRVRFVDLVSMPFEEVNDGSREAVGMTGDFLDYGLTGDGITVMLYDSDIVGEHPDFGQRISRDDSGSVNPEHATHVAGTLGGSGVSNQKWKGIAPDVEIRSFASSGGNWFNYTADFKDDVKKAIRLGSDLATMSLGGKVYNHPNPPCRQLGQYSQSAVLVDEIVTGRIMHHPLLFFEAAGNERQPHSGHGAEVCGKFDTIMTPATAKNSIAVGAINSNDLSLWNGSSFGPTDDGRLKPDIVAPGSQTTEDRGITSTFPGGGYVVLRGTSMATPVAAGTAALILEKWKSDIGRLEFEKSPPAPHTVKAILIHTADDRGRKGPDYEYGWGVLNAKSAIDLVEQNKHAQVIFTDRISQGQVKTKIFTPQSGKVRFTLVWDDLPGSRTITHDLINDLDLIVSNPNDPDHPHRPLVLKSDRLHMEDEAQEGVDRTNNVEMIMINGEPSIWKVVVNGTTVTGSQAYTLIMSDYPIVVPEFPVTFVVLMLGIILMVILSVKKWNRCSLTQN